MSASFALAVFERLIEQVDHVEAVAKEMDESNPPSASVLRRSALVLAVAAIDTYFHEQAAMRLRAAALQGAPHSARVSNFLKNVSAGDVSGAQGESHIRLRLSFMTLVAPSRIDAAITAWGGDPVVVWQNYCFAKGSRTDRERRQLELLYDRRNQIAHEGDWDSIQLDFRPMTQSHLDDCVVALRSLAAGIDAVL
ncbi:hypothetical protein ACQ3HE_11415 [Plantibacter auratus]|uniref:hypothetical protein n=1 Tax=Plantibacter auratus TaxID=272914 RepID=UPI003D3409B2